MNKKFLIGKKAVLDNLASEKLVKIVLSDRDLKLLEMIKRSHKNFVINNNKSYYDNLTHFQNHQFCLGFLEDETSKETDILPVLKNISQGLVVVLDRIMDPHNFGAIIRSCEVFGVKAIFYKKDQQCQINQTVIKTSMGAINHIHLQKVTNLVNLIKQLKDCGFWVYASCLDSDSREISKTKFAKKSCFIVGNEESGISHLIKNTADQKIYIKQIGKTQSLNVSVATGVLLWAFCRNFID